jgi:hypothetical protein
VEARPPLVLVPVVVGRVPPVASTDAESVDAVVVEAVVGEDDEEDEAAADEVAAEDVGAADDVAVDDVAVDDVAVEDVGSVLGGVIVTELVTAGGLVTAELTLGAEDATPRPDSRTSPAVNATAIVGTAPPNRARISSRPRAVHSPSAFAQLSQRNAPPVWAQDLPAAIGRVDSTKRSA